MILVVFQASNCMILVVFQASNCMILVVFQASNMARMQLEVERKTKKKSPIADIVSYCLERVAWEM